MNQEIQKLNIKDKRVLEQLELNSRQSNSQIAKKVQISKDAVVYRIKNLEKEKLILGYYSVLNITKLGFLTYKIMLTFQNTTSEIEKEIIEWLKSNKKTGWVVSCDGLYNLMIICWIKSTSDFDSFFNEFLKKYSIYIKNRDVIIITENHASRRAYLFDRKTNYLEDLFYKEELEQKQIDEIDLKIIKLLANNARMPLYKIAYELKMTAEGVSYRIKQLQKKNILQAFRPIINTSLLGYQYYNVLFKLKKFDNINKIFSFLKNSLNIIYFVKYIGGYDIGIDVEAKDINKFRDILIKIKDLFSEDIESYNPVLIYKEHKLTYFPE